MPKIDKLRAGKGQFTMEGRLQTLKEKLKKRFGKKTGGLTGGQVKLDKNKDGKISGEDFKMMKRKRGGSTPGLKDYVKKSDGQEIKIKAVDKKTGKEVFVSRKQILADVDSYRPVESGIKNFVSESEMAISATSIPAKIHHCVSFLPIFKTFAVVLSPLALGLSTISAVIPPPTFVSASSVVPFSKSLIIVCPNIKFVEPINKMNK